ncbi:hypothetical protein LZ012_00800 [Dechloromonas sp. XY25]|uniref:Uncharacterized protein n=1 Tax=Dechloromonas hankyongensis TaxID=2908002 RepID=A0ABS9JXA8_9RHOO|nr:hypothetical protein [Dechloromonas hankyongensis]MCG2575527.1 hypothetical protein [Dechloromonas hankyongensis]
MKRCLAGLIRCVVGLAMACVLVGTAGAEFNKFNPVYISRLPRIQIEVAPGNWGQMEVKDLQRLLEAVARQQLSDIPPLSRDTLSIYVIPRNDFPEVMLERNRDGAYVVRLTARDERLYQYAYQFAHELCHIQSHYDQKELRDGKLPVQNQWFEESLCEAVSIFTLRQLAASWDERPPSRKWSGYGAKFGAYADQLLAQAHRQLPPEQGFLAWYKTNAELLRVNPYDREKNEVIAGQLLTIFGDDPIRWQSVVYLNPHLESALQPFPKYLHDWYQACPEQNRVPVKGVFQLFGLVPKQE